MKGHLTCEDCHQSAPVLFQRCTDGKFVCARCVPDSSWREYLYARAAKAEAIKELDLFRRRGALARKNSRHMSSKEEAVV